MVYEASLTGLLKIILILLVAYYGIKFLAKLFAPMLVNYAAKKMDEKVKEHFQQHQDNTNTTSKESVNKKATKQVGEYIDFEEID